MTKEQKPQDGYIRRVTITIHGPDSSTDTEIPSTDHHPVSDLPFLKQEADAHNADSSKPWNVGVQQYDATTDEWKWIYQKYKRKQIKR